MTGLYTTRKKNNYILQHRLLSLIYIESLDLAQFWFLQL